MKKTVIKISLALALLLLWACSTEVTEEVVEEPPLQWYINFSWFDKSWGTDAVSAYITEKTGISVEYVIPTGDETQHLQQFLATGITADIITIESWNNYYGDFLAKEALAPLDVLAQDYELDLFANIHPSTQQWYEYEEHFYVYPNASYPLDSNQGYSNQTFLVRKDIYEAIGSPDMSTPEGFLSALQAAQDYCPTVNEQALIPLGLQEFTTVGNSSLEEYLQNFLAIPYEVDGIVVDRFTHPEQLLWLETLNEAYRQGLLLEEVFLDKRVQMEEKIAEGRYFALLFQWSDCSEQLQQLYLENPDQCYIAVDGPKNSQGENHTLAASSIQGWTITGISATSERQEEAITLLNFLLSDEGQKLIFLGMEDLTYTMEEGIPTFLPKAESLFFENRGEFDKIHGAVTTHWPMMNNLYAGEKGYLLPEQEYYSEIKDWTAPYTENFSLYAVYEFDYGSPAYFIKQADELKRGELLVNLLLAESQEIFYDYWQDYLLWQEENDYYLVLEEKQRQLEENKRRLD